MAWIKPAHEWDEDAICVHCGFDGAEAYHLRVNCTPEHAREPIQDSERFCSKRPMIESKGASHDQT